MGVGIVGMLLSLVAFAVGGYVGSRQEVFSGWIVVTFLGTVAFGALAGYGQVLRRRAKDRPNDTEPADPQAP